MSADSMQRASGVASIMATATLDVMVEGRGKLIDNLTLAQCTMLADLESNAVNFRESAAGNGYLAQFAIPIGLIDLDGKLLRVRLSMPGHTGTCTLYSISISLAATKDLPEVATFVYERSSLVFTAAGQVLDRPFRTYNYESIWLHDPSTVIDQFEVVPQVGQPSFGTREALVAMNQAFTRQENFVANATPFNVMFLAGRLDAAEAGAGFLTVKVTAAGSGTVDVITRRVIQRQADTNKSVSAYKTRKQYQRQLAKQQGNTVGLVMPKNYAYTGGVPFLS